MVREAIKRIFSSAGLSIRRIRPYEKNMYVWLKDMDIQSILDIGANTGQFALEMLKALPTARIYSFEPLHDCYELLVHNTERSGRVEAFNMAVGDIDCETSINRNSFSAASSILPLSDKSRIVFPYAAESKSEAITMKQLDSVTLRLNLKKNVLVKIDVQGYEAMVIKGGYRTISQASALIVETSFQCLYQGQALFSDLTQMIRELGFEYCGAIGTIYDPMSGIPLQEDSIYIVTKK